MWVRVTVIRYPFLRGRGLRLATPPHIKNPSASGRSLGESERHIAQEQDPTSERDTERVRERWRERKHGKLYKLHFYLRNGGIPDGIVGGPKDKRTKVSWQVLFA